MTQKSSYIKTQLSRLENQNGDGLKPSVQLYGANGKTNQLSVSPTQLDAISTVLMMDDSGDEASAPAQENVGNAIAQTLGLKKVLMAAMFQSWHQNRTWARCNRTSNASQHHQAWRLISINQQYNSGKAMSTTTLTMSTPPMSMMYCVMSAKAKATDICIAIVQIVAISSTRTTSKVVTLL